MEASGKAGRLRQYLCRIGGKGWMTYEDLQNFDRLPIKRKVALVHKEYPEIRCAYVVRGTLEGEALGQIIAFRGCFGRRYYDQFDWARFWTCRVSGGAFSIAGTDELSWSTGSIRIEEVPRRQ